MELQPGETSILHPSIFDLMQCMARGGRGGRGYEYQTIQFIDMDESLNLKERAILEATDKTRSLDENLNNVESVFKFQNDKISGYVVVPKLKMSVIFLGITPRNKILKVVAGCDCEVDLTSFISLLSTIKFYE